GKGRGQRRVAAAQRLIGVRGAVAGRFGAEAEGFQYAVLVLGAGRLPRHVVDTHHLRRRRRLERLGRGVGERLAHEVAEDRRGDLAAGLAVAERARRVEADEDAGDEVGRETDEPGVEPVARGAGLAGKRLADRGDLDPGAVLDDILHHRDDLVVGDGVDQRVALVLAVEQRIGAVFAGSGGL